MVDPNGPIYTYPQEVWDTKKCERIARRVVKDGMGTPYPFKGYLEQPDPRTTLGSRLMFNGGTVIDGKWYQGVIFSMPKLAKGFEIVYVPTWGLRLKKC